MPVTRSMMDLFQSRSRERLPVDDAELVLWRDAGLGNAEGFLDRLITDTPWRSEEINVWGKTYAQPRLIAWYGDDSSSYSYSGLTLSPLPWTPTLLTIKDRVETLSDATFNSVLLNYYRNQSDGMGFHADDEPELGPSPVIASVTFGEVRPFVLKHKRRKDVANVKLPLPSGSLLLMRGATQANWKHGIPKQSKPCAPRVNLTFRKILFESPVGTR